MASLMENFQEANHEGMTARGKMNDFKNSRRPEHNG